MLTNFSYVRPKSEKEAIKQLSRPEAGLLAGGTDLLGCLRDRVFDLKTVVSISGLNDLKGISNTPEGGLRIGALTTITEMAEHPVVNERYTALAQAARDVASPQLRNQGTVGGNLCQKPRCWYYRGDFFCLRKGGKTCFAAAGENQYHCILGGGPCFIVHPSDTAPAFVAFGASARIAGPKGSRTVPIEKFYVLPAVDVHRETVLQAGEIVAEVVLPPVSGIRSSYRKVRGRASWDFALAGMALAVRFDKDTVVSARAVLSGAAPIPWRSREIESAITGKTLDPSVIEQAAADSMKNANPLAENGYKVQLFRGMIEERLAAIGNASSGRGNGT
jgi:xanthine dehydrogenase YagS FAD-binding subunit